MRSLQEFHKMHMERENILEEREKKIDAEWKKYAEENNIKIAELLIEQEKQQKERWQLIIKVSGELKQLRFQMKKEKYLFWIELPWLRRKVCQMC